MYAQHSSSYKDTSGFIYTYNNVIYRQINIAYKPDYEKLISSNLYKELTEKKQLISHSELQQNLTETENFYLTLTPEPLAFITYPYEWTFSQLKDAALLTLSILEKSLLKGMILKDATPYNVQYVEGKPIFIDTLSFEIYDETKPWVAYYQFCESFLYPLLLAHYGVQEVHKTFQCYADGITAENTVKLLPKKCKYNLFNYLHLYLLGSIKIKNKSTSITKPVFYSKTKMQNLVTHLKGRIEQLHVKKGTTEWNNYYAETILSNTYLDNKKNILLKWLSEIKNEQVLDLGCNDGVFSILFSQNNNNVIATDFDSACINNLYHHTKENEIQNILPLCIDVMQPSTNQGFFNKERLGFFERVKVDTVLMLAIIHHLIITKNLTFEMVAKQMATICTTLIICT
jgi:2-polyprenyl-3-methyl-5-hydroxy-6-metoxy-1,4-benzoquinol methylase